MTPQIKQLYEALTKDEAIKAMREGKRVRHKYFASDEWMALTPTGQYKFEDGNVCPILEFWQYRKGDEWKNNWFIYGQPEPSLDKLAETVLREYVKFKDVNGSKSVSLLPLTIVDMMVEFIDRVNEQPEAIAAFEQSQQEGMEAITWKKNAYESALDYLSEMGYGSGTNFTSKGVASLLADFASQQTSAKDKEIKELKAEIDRLKKEVERLRKRPIVYGNPSHNQSK